jgi:hypothetical protein
MKNDGDNIEPDKGLLAVHIATERNISNKKKRNAIRTSDLVGLTQSSRILPARSKRSIRANMQEMQT